MRKWIEVFLLLCLDLAVKEVAFNSLAPGVATKIMPGFSLFLVRNFGVGFGFAQGWGSLILLVNVLIIVGVIYLLYQKEGLEETPGVLILAGGLGNIYDRLVLGYVRDFFLISYASYSWWVFNLADLYISLAVCLLLIQKKNS